ncbi:Non-specific lipid-transfer protein-like protein, partial [Cucurbita argyrosperma subsp. sororia]
MAMSIIPNLALFTIFIAAVAVAGATSPSPAPSATDCSAVVYQMMPCVEYFTIGSTKSNASTDCCKVVKDVMKSKADCMCDALKQNGRMGIQLNRTRALGLPATCGSPTSLADCTIAVSPVMAPPPVPSAKAPKPAKRAKVPSAVPCTKPPKPAPNSTSPTHAPVSPPSPPAPPQELAPSRVPVEAPAPSDDDMGPSSEDSSASATSFTTCSSLIVLPLALLASFGAL